MDEISYLVDGTVKTARLADWLGVSTRRINQLAQEGILTRTAPGRLNLRDSIQAYCAYIRESAAHRMGDHDIQAEKLRLTREQADKAALDNATRRKELTPLAEVEREWVAFCVDLRAKLLAIPSRVASQAALDKETTRIVDEELRAALEDLANAD